MQIDHRAMKVLVIRVATRPSEISSRDKDEAFKHKATCSECEELYQHSVSERRAMLQSYRI